MLGGELRHRVTIVGKNEVADGHYGFDYQTVTIARRIPACVEPLTGRELDRAQQIDPRLSHSVTLRYQTGVKAGQMLTYHDGRQGDRTFEIVGPPVDTNERNRQLVLLCKEAA